MRDDVRGLAFSHARRRGNFLFGFPGIVKDGRDIRTRPCPDLPELAVIGRTEIQQPLPKLDIPFTAGCSNLYLGYKGAKQMQAQGRTWTLTAGDFFLTPPGVDHSTGPMPVSRCAHYWLRIDLAQDRPFLGSPDHEPLRERLRSLSIAHGRASEALFAGVRAIYDACVGTMSPWRGVELKLQLGLCLVRLCEDIDRGGTGDADPLLDRVLDHVERHLGEDMSVQDLASVAGCSVSALQQHFRKREGLSPGEYIIRRRMAAAEQLLREGDLPLRAIAERLGFANERHFSTAFRRYHGQPPGKFRKQFGE